MDQKKNLKDFAIGVLGVSETDYSKIELMTAALRVKEHTSNTILVHTPPRINRKKKCKMVNHPPLDYGHNPDMIIVDEYDKFDFSTITVTPRSAGSVPTLKIRCNDDSKLDYKARFKRIGDMLRDTETGRMIPIRKLSKDIKRELGIK